MKKTSAALLLFIFLLTLLSIPRNGMAEPKALAGPVSIEGERAVLSNETSGLVERLAEAKSTGDAATAREIEALLWGDTHAGASVAAPTNTIRVVPGSAFGKIDVDRWIPDDVLVAGSELHEIDPRLASSSGGDLYVVVEDFGAMENELTLRIFKSVNGGQSWEFWVGITSAVDITSPSIAIGEGISNAVLVAFVEDANTVRVARINPADISDWNISVNETNVLGIGPPRIVTDTVEFDVWYGYLVYNSRFVDNWALQFCRTLDYGLTWEAPTPIALYCGIPGDVYDASADKPGIDFGSGSLYVAYASFPPSCIAGGRDVYLQSSPDFGGTWSPATVLTSSPDEEGEPRIAATKLSPANPTVLVAYNRFWAPDYDIWFASSLDGGSSWLVDNCLACATGANELGVDLETSYAEGRIHATYWVEEDIAYSYSGYLSPNSFSPPLIVNSGNTANAQFPWPSIHVNPLRTLDTEPVIAWTDDRSAMTLDVYSDSFTGITGVENSAEIPGFRLMQNLPNPFNPITTLHFSLDHEGRVSAAVFDFSGRRVRTLFRNRSYVAGLHTIVWNGSDDAGRRSPSGVYFCRLDAGDRRASVKMTLLN